MGKFMSYTDKSIISIAKEVKARFLDQYLKEEDITIFLCGGASHDEYMFRQLLGDKISSIKSKYRYVVYRPEDMFLELILGHGKYDLLRLENLLAESVSAIVIPLQSPGTFTELGAFANNSRLQNKLVIVMEPQYKNSSSFINIGPIRYLKTQTNSFIIHHELNKDSIEPLAQKITEAARDISKKNPLLPSLTNPIVCKDFYHALISIFDPILTKEVEDIAHALNGYTDIEAINTAAETTINDLINQRKVAIKDGMLTVPPDKFEEFVLSFGTQKRAQHIIKFISDLRLKALNRTLRRRVVRERAA